IPLTATASSPNGPITNVAFYNGSTLLAAITNAAYSLTLSNQPVGTYNFLAVATDNQGLSATSAVAQAQVQVYVPFTISVAPPSQTALIGSQVSYSVTVSSTNNFTNTVLLSVSGVPGGVGAAFVPPTIAG